MPKYPTIIRNNPGAFVQKNPWVSVDFEYPWPSMDPSIMGLSSGADAVSGYYNAEWRRLLTDLETRQKVTWVGHNALTVEREIIEAETGSKPSLDRVEDTMVRHYLCNADLCKGAQKGGLDDDDSEQKEKGQGFMDLWSMSSLYTELPQWKACRGEHCSGGCRVHDELGYNGIDTVGPDIALPRLRREMGEKLIPERLYEDLKLLTVITSEMTKRGVKMDRTYVRALEKEMDERKNGVFPSRLVPKIGKKGQELKTKVLVWDAPFNPRSPKAVLEYFAKNGVSLESTDKAEIREALNRFDEDDTSEVYEWLEKLFDFKDAGKGLRPWTDERYFHSDGLMHPRFPTTSTSTGRLSSSWPNFQNIPRKGWGQKVRAAIIPRDSSLMLVKADKSQLELRICLWYAGYPLPKDDAFKWLVENSDGAFHRIAEAYPEMDWSPRDWAKSVSHGADYGEGVKILKGKDLDSANIKRQIDAGALVVYRDWDYCGGVVSFTGSNLATRLFGNASYDNRRKALQIQEAYFARFAAIRDFQKRVSQMAQEGYVRTASGRYLTLHGSPEDKFKIALAMFGQGGGADDVQDGMRRYWEAGFVPSIQVHDELVFEMDRGVTDDYLKQFFSIMSAESTSLPGFSCPVKISKGMNWMDMTEVGKV